MLRLKPIRLRLSDERRSEPVSCGSVSLTHVGGVFRRHVLLLCVKQKSSMFPVMSRMRSSRGERGMSGETLVRARRSRRRQRHRGYLLVCGRSLTPRICFPRSAYQLYPCRLSRLRLVLLRGHVASVGLSHRASSAPARDRCQVILTGCQSSHCGEPHAGTATRHDEVRWGPAISRPPPHA